ncbi:hypothetical protein B0T26DRAFT_309766 [Lasiosphaeria miniovina]|uniref:DOMON domain-containing protein n=1 Tax=Lasiosphaeria miniovina TaxID=1954250 RepID=A0AA40ALC2_9PEZI|nr:uncharacterized protein B0T26DRAFT_309766 [Lasiosphaeria miniovina]KAK0717976.1 hypothetical protein B0T26DRAFT_309766 [Lasiosphaeria miniovina]
MARYPRSWPALAALLLGLLTIQATAAADTNSSAVSTLFVFETNTQFSINVPADDTSDDINFFMTAPTWFQYVALGFGRDMASSLMLVAYPATDFAQKSLSGNGGVTLSPRFSTGDTEPVYSPDIRFTLHAGTGIVNGSILVNGTCHNCRSWQTGALNLGDRNQSMIFALGPSLDLTSDDPAAPLRRHMGYGSFSVDMIKARGSLGGTVFGTLRNASDGANLVGSGLRRDTDKAATAHGAMFAAVALAVAPFDTLVTVALRRWPTLPMLSSLGYFALVIGAMVPGILISKEHILVSCLGHGNLESVPPADSHEQSQKFNTPHQVLGLLTIVLMFGVVAWGLALGFAKRAAKRRGEDLSPRSQTLSTAHTWLGRLVWLFFLINNGLGLKLSQQTTMFVLGYSVLAAGVVIFLLPVYFCIWRCTRQPKPPKDGDQEMDNIYTRHNEE